MRTIGGGKPAGPSLPSAASRTGQTPDQVVNILSDVRRPHLPPTTTGPHPPLPLLLSGKQPTTCERNRSRERPLAPTAPPATATTNPNTTALDKTLVEYGCHPNTTLFRLTGLRLSPTCQRKSGSARSLAVAVTSPLHDHNPYSTTATCTLAERRAADNLRAQPFARKQSRERLPAPAAPPAAAPIAPPALANTTRHPSQPQAFRLEHKRRSQPQSKHNESVRRRSHLTASCCSHLTLISDPLNTTTVIGAPRTAVALSLLPTACLLAFESASSAAPTLFWLPGWCLLQTNANPKHKFAASLTATTLDDDACDGRTTLAWRGQAMAPVASYIYNIDIIRRNDEGHCCHYVATAAQFT
ncbi:hypothetical protein D9619_002516 [Psilocybe cf. subviscida]|uniref:Uncharacterized protein n=1 Tax=Psilocybe cf. subviscida TaxID=2480587 RepID=A0A8H5ETR8_9AGAR|nr:hypothetical protein D9619_002516 [Psilocybe cf. subviscida]